MGLKGGRAFIIAALLLITCSCSSNNSQVPDKVNNSTPVASEAAVPADSGDSEEYILPEYYAYSGGELPEDIVKPIEYTVKQPISADKPAFSFQIQGRTVQSYGLTGDKTKYYLKDGYIKVQSIIVNNSALAYHQKLEFQETEIPDITATNYGFALDDWNFDGHLDISLWKETGGTSLNAPHYYWFWDNEQGRFVSNPVLEELSEFSFVESDHQAQELISSNRNPNGYNEEYFAWEDGQITLIRSVKTAYSEPDDSTGESKAHITVAERIDGKMQVTEEYYAD
ncbi:MULTISPECIES: hypothetical protein [unclassified Paenibacillus]|uniref:XAC2610-related protein n=1 Tax=unclassified Paenibacillus TaxID=185978 RepID=UPI0024072840|nr:MULTISPECIES: hypothetical protein [unclassified Paenibacillus]MDF9840638.1 hypothetical protein [Paenibacillus sp. PastF-2]MDF9847221.1 hypothetical protein [Paenibacillus sp. PastM-2]MDF9853792.1 hypothetical protein [Paenibacillus sp. PastF-1]MDH6478722.1 hypothetical protein [Paenibacillus sp. PastH-2]MDH6506454.1 hypothetical protein [Paenibacillus sp. PastM-3]